MEIDGEKKYDGTLLRKFSHINDLLLATYHIAPYSGCEFGCAYCDAWSYGDQPINEKISICPDFLKRLSAELPNTDSGELIGFTLGEPYQPAERRYRISREALTLLGEHNRPILILTKSPVILDDLDLLKQLNSGTLAIVTTTILTLDPELLNHLEYGVPLPEERIEMVATLKKSGIPCGFFLNPIMPFLTDDRDDMLSLLETVAETEPDFLVWDYLWIPNDRHRKRINALLQNIDDKLVPEYDRLYKGNAQPSSVYRKSMDRFLIRSCRRMGLEPRIPPKLYQEHLAPENVTQLIERREAFLC